MRAAGWAWLVLCVVAAVHLAARGLGGPIFRTDLLALLPQEERDPDIQRAKDRMLEFGGRQIALFVGHADPATARAAGGALAAALARSGLFATISFAASAEDDRALGRIFHAHRGGLLADSDRERLAAGRGGEIAARAVAALHLPGAPLDPRFLRDDPFLLLPAFLAALPRPLPQASREEGVLMLRDDGVAWALLSARIAGDPFAIAVQQPVVSRIDAELARLAAATPGLRTLRAGAVFYAHEAAGRAIAETRALSAASLAGLALLILAVFRALRPLLLGALSLAVGIMVAFSACLAWFGDLHVGAMLFGVGLIGVAIDYSLLYLAEGLAPDAGAPAARLARILPGLALGMGVTVIGYLTLLLSPFPGLHELAVFSVVGILAAFLTVVLWVPALDRAAPDARRAALLAAAEAPWRFWRDPRRRGARRVLGGALIALAAIGALRFGVDDDVRRMQRLSPELRRDEQMIERLTGRGAGGPFLVVRAVDAEAALVAEEALLPALERARAGGALAGFQAVAQVVPSAARQREARELIAAKLAPILPAQRERLGVADAGPAPAETPALTLGALVPVIALAPLAMLEVPGGAGMLHLVPLQGVERAAELAEIARDAGDVRYVDPVADTTRLLGDYRRRALALVGISLLLMLPALAWRYGPLGALRVVLPPVAALAATPLILAAAGLKLTFFSAMALVLVLAMGVDYAIFCREAGPERRARVMIGVALAALSTMLAFGLLAASSVAAVSGFGTSLLIGIGLALAFAPLAGPRP